MLLLDTHAFIWLASDLRKLPKAAKSALREHAGALYLSGISGLEIALSVKRDRLDLPTDPESFTLRALEQHGIEEIPVSAVIGCRAARLPEIHNDPFDRIIIATAQFHRAKILTKDAVIPDYPDTDVIWS
jgi:PIN domain nuclease of toxin-antitoxin system